MLHMNGFTLGFFFPKQPPQPLVQLAPVDLPPAAAKTSTSTDKQEADEVTRPPLSIYRFF
jgi:hypothetical protein